MADVRDKVVVLTGASSGIGRATARRLARRGASLVLAARRADLLAEVAHECEDAGGRALAVPTDVADAGEVAALAEAAERRFGSIDAWVNNAAVGTYGRLEDVPVEEIRRVLDVNVLGYVHGMQQALPRFRGQGHGTVVNVASLVSHLGVPYLAPYVLSKHAVLGLAESVHLELADEPRIHVCTILPGVIDTPFYGNAANHTGRRIKAASPAIRPEAVARAVAACLRRPRRARPVGISTRLLLQQHRLLPRVTDRVGGAVMRRNQFGRGTAADTSGNLFDPADDGGPVRGGWRGGAQRVARTAAVGSAAVGIAEAVRRRSA